MSPSGVIDTIPTKEGEHCAISAELKDVRRAIYKSIEAGRLAWGRSAERDDVSLLPITKRSR